MVPGTRYQYQGTLVVSSHHHDTVIPLACGTTDIMNNHKKYGTEYNHILPRSCIIHRMLSDELTENFLRLVCPLLIIQVLFVLDRLTTQMLTILRRCNEEESNNKSFNYHDTI